MLHRYARKMSGRVFGEFPPHDSLSSYPINSPTYKLPLHLSYQLPTRAAISIPMRASRQHRRL